MEEKNGIWLVNDGVICQGKLEVTNDELFQKNIKMLEQEYSLKDLRHGKDVYRLMRNETYSWFRLICLFSSQKKNEELDDLLPKLTSAEKMILDLESSGLLNETIREIANMWLGFGFFATYGLGCIDFCFGDGYSEEELENLQKLSKIRGICLTNDARECLENAELAKENTRVYTLAKRLNKLCNR